MSINLEDEGDFEFGFAEEITRSQLVERYEAAKAVKVASQCLCPYCMTFFIKKVYQQAFCNRKCKDKYWNIVDDKRFARMKRFS